MIERRKVKEWVSFDRRRVRTVLVDSRGVAAVETELSAMDDGRSIIIGDSPTVSTEDSFTGAGGESGGAGASSSWDDSSSCSSSDSGSSDSGSCGGD